MKSLVKVGPQVFERATIIYGRYTKGVPFLSKMVTEVRYGYLNQTCPVVSNIVRDKIKGWSKYGTVYRTTSSSWRGGRLTGEYIYMMLKDKKIIIFTSYFCFFFSWKFMQRHVWRIRVSYIPIFGSIFVSYCTQRREQKKKLLSDSLYRETETF